MFIRRHYPHKQNLRTSVVQASSQCQITANIMQPAAQCTRLWAVHERCVPCHLCFYFIHILQSLLLCRDANPPDFIGSSQISALNMTSLIGNQTSGFCLHPKIMFIHKRVILRIVNTATVQNGQSKDRFRVRNECKSKCSLNLKWRNVNRSTELSMEKALTVSLNHTRAMNMHFCLFVLVWLLNIIYQLHSLTTLHSCCVEYVQT